MRLSTRSGIAACAAALAATGAAFAEDPMEVDVLRTRVAELEAAMAHLQNDNVDVLKTRIAQLETAMADMQGDNWLTEQRADQIRGLVEDVLADANTRASLLQSGMGIDDLSVVTVGIIRYISGHRVKWTNDIGFATNGVTGTFDSDGAGWLIDGAGQDRQVVLRSQFQLLF